MAPPNPLCPICRQTMIREIYGDGFRCIYPHEPTATRVLRMAAFLLIVGALLMAVALALNCSPNI